MSSSPYIVYYSNGKKYIEHHQKDNTRHRDDGLPAYIRWYENGQLEILEYAINGIYHRLDGPAIIQFDPDGNIISTYYAINGEHVPSDHPDLNTSLQMSFFELLDDPDRWKLHE